jgi:hypothetical protein
MKGHSVSRHSVCSVCVCVCTNKQHVEKTETLHQHLSQKVMQEQCVYMMRAHATSVHTDISITVL